MDGISAVLLELFKLLGLVGGTALFFGALSIPSMESISPRDDSEATRKMHKMREVIRWSVMSLSIFLLTARFWATIIWQ